MLKVLAQEQRVSVINVRAKETETLNYSIYPTAYRVRLGRQRDTYVSKEVNCTTCGSFDR